MFYVLKILVFMHFDYVIINVYAKIVGLIQMLKCQFVLFVELIAKKYFLEVQTLYFSKIFIDIKNFKVSMIIVLANVSKMITIEKSFVGRFQQYIICHHYRKTSMTYTMFEISFRVFGFLMVKVSMFPEKIIIKKPFSRPILWYFTLFCSSDIRRFRNIYISK